MLTLWLVKKKSTSVRCIIFHNGNDVINAGFHFLAIVSGCQRPLLSIILGNLVDNTALSSDVKSKYTFVKLRRHLGIGRLFNVLAKKI